MESLVMEHLGGVQDDPLFLGTAAKLLYFVGHHDLALELAETALDQDVSHAATLMMYAQLQMLEGDLDRALEYYDFALQHSADDQFRSMILVLKATALRAQGSLDALPEIVDEIVARDEDVRLLMHASLLGDRPECDASVLELAPLLPVEQWQQLLRLNYYVNVRLFKNAEHRKRLIEGILQLAIRSAGPAVLFDELESDLPELCAELVR
jgi:tetratricopeptide (TPR) repeat protein